MLSIITEAQYVTSLVHGRNVPILNSYFLYVRSRCVRVLPFSNVVALFLPPTRLGSKTETNNSFEIRSP